MKVKRQIILLREELFPMGKKCIQSICHCFISQLLRKKLQTAEMNVSFATDFNEPKMSSSVFYYTQKPNVRIGTALWSTLQHNSIHQSEDNHAITQSLVPFTSVVRFILIFFFPYLQKSSGAGKRLSHICLQYSFTPSTLWWKCRYKNEVEISNHTNWNVRKPQHRKCSFSRILSSKSLHLKRNYFELRSNSITI